jgi:type IV secretion system protein VirB11
MDSFYLESYLGHLKEFLDMPGVTDIWVNEPYVVWTESLGGKIQRYDRPELTAPTLERLSRQIAAHSAQGISRTYPIMSASIPGGTRVQIIAPPATRGHMCFAFRKHISTNRTLDEYKSEGAFARTQADGLDHAPDRNADLMKLLHAKKYDLLLRKAILSRRNILISGGTSSGKTTFLNTLLSEIPPDERLILIEDTPELNTPHLNQIGLIATRGEQGEAHVTTNDLLSATLRLRPDRIIVGELRGPEAFTFLRAINTGHPGSMTTIHADTPQRAIEQLTLLVLQSGTNLTRQDIRAYVQSTVDVFVQLDRDAQGRHISKIMISE